MARSVKMRFYKHVPKRYAQILMDNFTHINGELRPAYESNKIVQVVVAKSRHNKLLGWCAVYKSIRDIDPIYCKDYSLGIFVDPKYRHRGVGGKLRRKAILWCLRQGKIVWWFRDGYIATLATKESMKYIDGLEKPAPVIKKVPENTMQAVTPETKSTSMVASQRPSLLQKLFPHWML